jgi:hypothetical protein
MLLCSVTAAACLPVLLLCQHCVRAVMRSNATARSAAFEMRSCLWRRPCAVVCLEPCSCGPDHVTLGAMCRFFFMNGGVLSRIELCVYACSRIVASDARRWQRGHCSSKAPGGPSLHRRCFYINSCKQMHSTGCWWGRWSVARALAAFPPSLH